MGASSYTYATLRWTQGLEDWIDAHACALAFLRRRAQGDRTGQPKNRASPSLRATNLASTAPTPISPPTMRPPFCRRAFIARATRRRLRSGCWSLNGGSWRALRHQRFFSLEQANAAVAVLLGPRSTPRSPARLNVRAPSCSPTIDAPALKPLPREPYVYAEWRKVRLGPDYHIEVDTHWYSAPFQLIKEPVEARITARTVEIFHKGTRVAAHPRSRTLYRHTTTREHMPSSHRRHLRLDAEALESRSRRDRPCDRRAG